MVLRTHPVLRRALPALPGGPRAAVGSQTLSVPAQVDVLLPVRDGAGTLGEALESLRGQTLPDWRCLLLDDGSRDDSFEVARAFAERDARFRLHRLPARGLVSSLNEGVRTATAPFVARLDADDRMEPARLARQLELQQETGATVVGTGVRFFGREPSSRLRGYETWLNAAVTHDEIARELWIESAVAHPSVLVQLEPLRSVGGYRETAYPEDYDLWLRGLRSGWRFAKVPEVLTWLRDHEGRLTHNDPRYSRRAFIECKVHHLVEQRSLRGREVLVWGAGKDGRRIAKALRRRGVILAGFVDIAPSKIGRRMLGAEVAPVRSLLRLDPPHLVLACVGLPEARAEIRRFLSRTGRREGPDFVCLA